MPAKQVKSILILDRQIGADWLRQRAISYNYQNYGVKFGYNF